MGKGRILFVNQEIMPFVPESENSYIGRYLPSFAQEKGREIRVFMPRFSSVNERKNQLHEVIRLSGMNLIVNNADHQLIIKVGSIPSARMQVYFIDNEEYFTNHTGCYHMKRDMYKTIATLFGMQQSIILKYALLAVVKLLDLGSMHYDYF